VTVSELSEPHIFQRLVAELSVPHVFLHNKYHFRSRAKHSRTERAVV
jgi:hypothetical protein